MVQRSSGDTAAGLHGLNGLRFANPYRGYRIADSSPPAGEPPEDPPRGPMERASDELASWFGDHDAERRREADICQGGWRPKDNPAAKDS